MLGKLFGFRKKEISTSVSGLSHSKNEAFAFLGVDMHSHVLPGIDDGAQTIEESLFLVRSMISLGYKYIVTTPHIKSDIYPNTTVIIKNALKELQQALLQHDINIPIRAAAEYYIDDRFMEMLEHEELLTLNDKEILVEFSFMFEPVRLPQTIFRIETKGYTPVLAHPERYPFYHNKYDVFTDLKDRGCLLQLNTLSLAGYYGKAVKDMAERLLSDGLYDYCGTDLHHERHIEGLQKFIQSKAFTYLLNYPFINKKLKN